MNTNVCEGNGWRLVQLNDQTDSWYDNIGKDELKGALGVTFIEPKERRSLFHKMSGIITRITHFFRNLDKGLTTVRQSACCKSLDLYKTTHAFIIADTKPASNDTIEIADSDYPGLLLHDYKLKKVLDNKKKGTVGYYTKIALVIPPKELRDRISLIAKASSSKLEVGNVFTKTYKLKNDQIETAGKIEKLMKERNILDLKKERLESRSRCKNEVNRKKIAGIQVRLNKLNEIIKVKAAHLSKITNKLNIKQARKNELMKTERGAKYHYFGLRIAGIAGKLPIFNIRPFFNSINIFTKRIIFNTTFDNYLNVLEGKPITQKDGSPKEMICSEFASKMLKMAKIDLALEKAIGFEELNSLKNSLKFFNKLMQDKSFSPEFRKEIQIRKNERVAEYSAQIKDIIRKKMKTDRLFTMKDNGIIPTEVLILGQRSVAGFDKIT